MCDTIVILRNYSHESLRIFASVHRRAALSLFGLTADKQSSSDMSESKTLFFRLNRVILVRLYTTSSYKVKISTICTNKYYVNIITTYFN